LKKNQPKPPATLSAEAKKLWQSILAESDMDAAGFTLLNILAESFDRMREAQAHIKEYGIVLTETTAAGNIHHRANPSCSIERDAKAAMMRAWKLLGYDQAPAGVF